MIDILKEVSERIYGFFLIHLVLAIDVFSAIVLGLILLLLYHYKSQVALPLDRIRGRRELIDLRLNLVIIKAGPALQGILTW